MELREYLRILQKRRWLALLFLAVSLGGAAVATSLTVPVYSAQTKLFVGQRQIAATELSQGATVNQLSLQLLKSYAIMIETRPIAERAVEQDALPVSPAIVASQIVANPILDTQLIQLSFESTDPALAQRVVNAVATAFVSQVEKIETPKTPNAEPAVKVSIVEPALRPAGPVRPRPLRNMALAFVVGCMLGVAIAFLAEYLDTTIKSREDVEDITGVPVLAAIPKVATHGKRIYLENETQSVGAEAFRKLRTSIQFLAVDGALETLLVTSPFAQDGKTTIALNLAASFSTAGLRTILVEADLRRPTLFNVFASDGQRGLTTCLIGRVPLDRAILPTSVRNLSVLPAGSIPPNPAELLASEHMTDLLRRLKEDFDVVIVDAPPLLPVADSSALAPRVDGVLLVARAGTTNRERLRESSSLVGKVGGRLLGVVLNHLRPTDSQYGYYQYGYPSSTDTGTAAKPTRTREEVPAVRDASAREAPGSAG